MRIWILAAASSAWLGLIAPASSQTVEGSLAALVSVAVEGPGITREEQRAAAIVSGFGATAIPGLLRLLRHDNVEVRTLAAYTIRDIEGLRVEHLDRLMESQRRDNSWLPPAIARIGTPRAIEFLLAELEKHPEPHTQHTFAWRKLGRSGVPYLLRAFDCEPCDADFLSGVAFVLRELEMEASGAVERLLTIARDPARSDVARGGSIEALASIGAPAQSALVELRETTRADAEFAELMHRAVTSVDGARLTRCDEGSREHQLATEALLELDETIASLELKDDYQTALATLRGLLETRCFEMSVESEAIVEPDSTESLQSWWSAGGRDWLASYLDWPRAGRSHPLHLVLAPDTRRTLYANQKSGALHALVCAPGDAPCGRTTTGWRRRAERTLLDKTRRRDADLQPQRDCETTTNSDGTFDYQVFRQCLESSEPRVPSLPHGALRPPEQGWLLLRGRRGHYEFCDEMRAYNLENGDAWRSASCSELVLRRDGSVDFERTRELGRDQLEAGAVNLENLREAVWMMLLGSETDRVRRRASRIPLPEGRPIFWIRGRANEQLGKGWGVSGSTAQTRLTWQVVSENIDTTGRITWPSSYDPVEDHTVELLTIAEDSWRDGCPASFPPPKVLESKNDDPRTLRLGRAMASWARRDCAEPPP